MNTTFGIGNVLATGFRIWIKNFVPFMLLTALIHAPVLIWGISTVQGEMNDERVSQVITFEQSSTFLVLVLNILLSAALTYGVVMELQGQRASLGACITMGLKRFFPALGTMLLMCLCIGGVGICAIIPLGGILGALGVVVSLVPILWVACMLYVATQASVIERPGMLRALARSRELTRGHKFSLAILLIFLGLLSYCLHLLVQEVTLPHSIPSYMYLNLAQQMIVGSVSAVVSSVAYYFLRAEKEGTSVDELAAVFG